MKNLILFAAVMLFAVSCAFAQTGEINIIPRPKSVKVLPEKFELNYKTKIVARDAEGRKFAGILNDYLLKIYGFKLEYKETASSPKNAIIFEKLTAAGKIPSDAAYGLYITKNGVRINARENPGFFYGLQSFLQLIPADFKGRAKIQAADILDEPRFRYRGMHLDVGRHFFPVEFVKKYIDLMAQYKFNNFHWHLTEDQGWRIEIKKYPRLTEIGSRRKETMKEKNRDPYIGDGIPVEGFYTQDEIKDVVRYAKERFITVIPEIELPGHSSAALAAYPELGCKENYEYKVQTTWGIFKEVYCPTEKTFQFLEDVLSETIELFPDSPYIHIGGDEVLKDHWKESAFVQELKAKENLKDEHEVQSYFIRRMEKFINSRGKRIIGWDEILEGGLAPNATVMSWRGEKGGIEAAKAGHDVIMTPTDFMYFDYSQGDPRTEPINIGNLVTLEKVYSYNPQPKELSDDEKQYILGAQGNVWTEYMKTPDKVEYMVFPRILALSEVVWSPLDGKDFANFQRRLSAHFPRLDKQNVNYRIPEPSGLKNILLTGGEDTAEIDLKSLFPNGKIYYMADGSEPGETANPYNSPIKLKLEPDQKIELKIIVINEKGRKSVVYGATLWRRSPLKASDFQSTTGGMNYSLFKGEFKSVKDFENSAPEKTGDMRFFDFRQLGEKENFGVVWDAYLNIPADGIYEFQLDSKDGAVLQIADETLIDLDGVHARKSVSGDVPLEKGFHRFRLKFFQTTGNINLNLRFGIKGQPLRGLGNQLFR